MHLLRSLLLFFHGLSFVQSFVPPPSDIKVVPSKLFGGAEISFKRTTICETTEGVNAYSGYVTLPKDLIPDAAGWQEDQSAHIYFWFFESRNDPSTSPTSIYLGGGPGITSLDGMSGFPCFINPDSNSTTLNEYSWSKNVNILYIDQPVGTGFTYVDLQNGILDVLTQSFEPVSSLGDLPALNHTALPATLDITGPATAANTTLSAARTMWRFAQVWFNEFPEWTTENNEISLWTVSYGGLYGPAFFSHFHEQNDLIRSGEVEPQFANATVLDLRTLGLADACVDGRTMALGSAQFAHNNTYGVQVFSDELYAAVTEGITAPETGCYSLIDQCRALAEEGDPEGFGRNATVNSACSVATKHCFLMLQAAYTSMTDRSPFDIASSNLTLHPPAYHAAFYNQEWVQQDLGVPLNFTMSSGLVPMLFLQATGDPMILSLRNIESVLERGNKVALIYGDRDYRCNWYGGENVSLVLESPSSNGFRSAGYQNIATSATYDGGFVREHGNLSFSRIFQSGHGVAAYQPETMSEIFERVMFGRDIATGDVDLGEDSDYSTEGPLSVAEVLNELPEPEVSVCYVLWAPFSCTWEQQVALADGLAVVENWIVVEPPGILPAEIVMSLSNTTEDGEGLEEEAVVAAEESESAAWRSTVHRAIMLVTMAGMLFAV